MIINPYMYTDIASNLVRHYKLDEASGNVIDSSPYAVHMTNSG